MSWRHRIAMVVLAVFAAAPLVGTACALACTMPSTGHHAHHGSGQPGHDPARTSADGQVGAVSTHDCGSHDTVLRQPATTAASRDDFAPVRAPEASDIVDLASAALESASPARLRVAPGGTAPPTLVRLVLRI